MERLFELKERNRLSPKGFSESYWGFLDETANHADVVIRDMIESWYRRYAPGDGTLRKEMKRRLETDERAALFELYLNELLIRLGCSVSIHPDLPNSSRHPDFKAVNKGGEAFYVEAVTVQPGAERDDSNRAFRTADALSKLNFGDRLVHLEGVLPSLDAIKLKPILGRLTLEAMRFPIEDLQKLQATSGFASLPIICDQRTGLRGRVVPAVQGLNRSRDDRGIGGFSVEYSLDEYPERIQSALFGKGSVSAYGDLDAPLVVALDIGRFNLPTQLIEQGLYGGDIVGPRLPGGFGSSDRTAMENVSAALTFLDVSPSSFHYAPTTLWHNLNCSRPLGHTLTCFPQRNPDLPGKRLHEIFGVSPDWHFHHTPPPEPKGA